MLEVRIILLVQREGLEEEEQFGQQVSEEQEEEEDTRVEVAGKLIQIAILRVEEEEDLLILVLIK